jgi:hypothetical protein
MKYLVHVDGNLPNLALMRLSTYFRSRGEEVRLVRGTGQRQLWDPPGEVYASSIFDFSGARRRAIDAEWSAWGPVRWGGTGVRVESSLADLDAEVDWEAIAPDYSLYPGEERSIGFTQRGCRLRCGFCVVPRKEGAARSVRTVPEIWRGEGNPKKLLLLDNDFFGQPEWRARVEEIRIGRFSVCLSQGINIRMVNEESAAALASIEYRDNDFERRRLYTAWDNLGDEKVFRRGVELLERAGVPPRHLMVYMLVGYAPAETWERIFHRFNALVALGCRPYPMVFDGAARPDLKAFQRWVVMGLYRSCAWRDYRDARLVGVQRGEVSP